jgi:ATP-dependent Lon protease
MSEQNIKNTPITVTLPVLPLRGLVAFPAVQLNVEIMRPFSLKAFTVAATETDARILLVTQKDVADDVPTEEDFYSIGTLASIKHVVKNAQNNLSVIFEGISRVKIRELVRDDGGFYRATATLHEEKRRCGKSTRKADSVHKSYGSFLAFGKF